MTFERTKAMNIQNEELQVIVYGLGPIGVEILKKCEETIPGKIVGAVDIDPNKVGKDVGLLTNSSEKGIKVVSSINEVNYNNNLPRFAIHATGSNLVAVWPQIKELLDHGFSVVSTCEQLSYPWYRHPRLSAEIDKYAKSKHLTVIGSGVNPGFVMDKLVLNLTSVVSNVSSIQVDRHVDVKQRRAPLQKKVGVGMKKDEFIQYAREEKIGHVGLEESLRLIAAGLNVELESVENELRPTISDHALELPHFQIEPGDVNGQHQSCRGKTADGITIELNLMMSTDVKSEDRIMINGDMKQELIIPNGIFGDSATSSIMVNTVKTLVFHSKPGLQTVKDMAVTRSICL